jgi:hypothetical protein
MKVSRLMGLRETDRRKAGTLDMRNPQIQVQTHHHIQIHRASIGKVTGVWMMVHAKNSELWNEKVGAQVIDVIDT